MTAIVSPKARATPSTLAPMMPGRAYGSLVNALTAAAAADIDKAAAAGKLTADQATMQRAKVADHIGTVVDRKRTATK